jgi:ketosteroid isomerase-like protein
MSVHDNKALVNAYFTHFTAGRFEEALDMLAPDASIWICGKPDKFLLGGVRTKAQFSEQVRGVTGVVPSGLTLHATSLVAEGRRVVAEADVSGITATGRAYDNKYVFIFEIEHGRIKTLKEYLDTMHAKETFLD